MNVRCNRCSPLRQVIFIFCYLSVFYRIAYALGSASSCITHANKSFIYNLLLFSPNALVSSAFRMKGITAILERTRELRILHNQLLFYEKNQIQNKILRWFFAQSRTGTYPKAETTCFDYLCRGRRF